MTRYTCMRSFLCASLLTLGCGSECVLSDGKCPSNCDQVTAHPIVDGPAGKCAGDDERLECRDKGPNTTDDACIVSPDGGTMYLTDGTSARRLAQESYTECTQEQWDTLSDVKRCE